MVRRARRQEQILEWAVKWGKPFTLQNLQEGLKASSEAIAGATTKLRKAKKLVRVGGNRNNGGFLYALPNKNKQIQKLQKGVEREQEEIQEHIIAFAVGYITAWTDAYAASHRVPAPTVAYRVGQALQASARR